MKKTDIIKLNNVTGVAKDMGDFFAPDDARMHTNILIREGYIKSEDHGKVWGAMIATKIGGELNFLFLFKVNKADHSWEVNTIIVNSGLFQNIVKERYLF